MVRIVVVPDNTPFKFSNYTRVLSASNNDILARYFAKSLTMLYSDEDMLANFQNCDGL